MAKKGRPPKVTIEQLIDNVEPYIESTALPIVAEYAHQQGITAEYLYQLAKKEKDAGRGELSNAIKKITERKAIQLEKGALLGKFSPSMAIFSLKQLGWRDKWEAEVKSEEKVVIVDDFK